MLHVATANRIGFGILALLLLLIAIPGSISRLWSLLTYPAARPTSRRGLFFQIGVHLVLLAMGVSCTIELGFMAVFAQTPPSNIFFILNLFVLVGAIALAASRMTGQRLW